MNICSYVIRWIWNVNILFADRRAIKQVLNFVLIWVILSTFSSTFARFCTFLCTFRALLALFFAFGVFGSSDGTEITSNLSR